MGGNPDDEKAMPSFGGLQARVVLGIGAGFMRDEYIKSVRLSDSNRKALLSSIESGVRSVEESNRADDRSECHLLDIPVQVTHPDGAKARFLICMRNISSGGISFIHGGFLYPGSKVIIQMPTIWGDIENIKGKVVNCRLVQGQNHEIGIQFDAPSDRRRYLTLPGETPLDPDPDSNERSELTGRVLYIDTQVADAKLAAFHLKDSQVTLDSSTTCEDAITKIKSSAVDLIMLSSEIEGIGEESAIESIRSTGFKGPIIFVVSRADAAKAESSGANSSIFVLTKPYSPAKLIAALSQCLADASTSGDGPIYSELASNPDAVELVQYYLGYVEELSAQLRDSIEKDEVDTALQSCRTLMETGTGYGFSAVSIVAKNAVTELSSSMSINESISEIQRLLGVCARIESKDNSEPNSEPEKPDPQV
jgi:CheY-like chemotaxis protein